MSVRARLSLAFPPISVALTPACGLFVSSNFSRGKSIWNTRVERVWGEVNKITWKYKLIFQVCGVLVWYRWSAGGGHA